MQARLLIRSVKNSSVHREWESHVCGGFVNTMILVHCPTVPRAKIIPLHPVWRALVCDGLHCSCNSATVLWKSFFLSSPLLHPGGSPQSPRNSATVLWESFPGDCCTVATLPRGLCDVSHSSTCADLRHIYGSAVFPATPPWLWTTATKVQTQSGSDESRGFGSRGSHTAIWMRRHSSPTLKEEATSGGC